MKTIAYRQLSTLLDSGMGILQALGIVSSHTRGRTKRTLLSIHRSIEAGSSFTEAVSGEEGFFTPFEITIIQAGEISGRLENNLRFLADYMEKVSSWRRKIMGGMIYPLIVLHAAIFIPPAPILILKGFLPYVFVVSKSLFWIYGIGFGIFLATRISGRIQVLLYLRDYLLLVIPVSGGILRSLSIARFTTSLAGSYRAGISIGPALKFAAEACGNEYMKEKIRKQIRIVEKGGKVTEVLQKSKVFPETVLEMVHTGEEAGKMEEMLSKASSYCENKAEAAITILINTLPVILYLAVALYVGIKVISFYSGYLKILE